MSARQKFAFRTVVALLTLFLLISMGGAIVASPLLVFLHWRAARGSSQLLRLVFGFLTFLVALETFWLVAYLLFGERQPFILLVPVTGALLATWVWHFAVRVRTSQLSSPLGSL